MPIQYVSAATVHHLKGQFRVMRRFPATGVWPGLDLEQLTKWMKGDLIEPFEEPLLFHQRPYMVLRNKNSNVAIFIPVVKIRSMRMLIRNALNAHRFTCVVRRLKELGLEDILEGI